MRRTITNMLFLALISLPLLSLAQDDKCKAELDFGADVMSRYVWRGTQYGGDFPSIQPAISLSISNFTIGTWGAYSLSGASVVQEFDLFATYSFNDEMFTIGITDYYFPNAAVDYKYFDYKANSTGHILEGSFTYNGVEKFPLSILFAVNFFGADVASIEDDPGSADFNAKTGIKYSNYLEFSYPCKVKTVDVKAFAGLTLTSPKEAVATNGYIGEVGFYGPKAGLVNLGINVSKEIKLTEDFSLPISGSLVVNPLTSKVYYVFGISF